MHLPSVVHRRIAQRGRRRLLHFGTVGWVLVDFLDGRDRIHLGSDGQSVRGIVRGTRSICASVQRCLNVCPIADGAGCTLSDFRTRDSGATLSTWRFEFSQLSAFRWHYFPLVGHLLTFRHTGRYVLIVAAIGRLLRGFLIAIRGLVLDAKFRPICLLSRGRKIPCPHGSIGG